MNMKDHILAALAEQLSCWEEQLAILSDDQITIPRFDLNWSIKDVMIHLWAWQQISSARVEAAVLDREPAFPGWVAESPERSEENPDQTNAQIYDLYHAAPWTEVHRNWSEGYLRLIELAKQISERFLLDAERYPWLNGYPLAFVLVASYDHHREHFEKLLASLQRSPKDTSSHGASTAV